MITRDYILRQIQQLVQALARVMMLRSTQQDEEAMIEVDRALNELPELGVLIRSDLNRDDVLTTCGTGNNFNPEKALAVADLLVEKAELVEDGVLRMRNLRYALWLYEAALATPAVAIPMDLYDRISWLKNLLDEA